MIRIKTNDKPRLPKCEMVCDTILDEKLKPGKSYTINKTKTNSKLTIK